jgi:glyoxylase-like metal-dependent hydrolase (beta-lactamase superfamily II)
MSSQPSQLPSPTQSQIYVTISPLSGGNLTLPDSAFVSPANLSSKRFVPSLSFLIVHPGRTSESDGDIITSKSRPLRILFDLGLRHNISEYSEPQQRHLETRHPFETQPGVAAILEKGGIDRAEIDVVIFSHVHYDHHGDPEDFQNAQFIVGNGSLNVLKIGLPPELGSHQHFSHNLLPQERTKELPPATATTNYWKPLGPFPHTLDLLGDGSLYVIDTPGHLPGHINLLCRTAEEKWVCLCGDAYHDPRLLSGEKDIGTWQGDGGRTCCIHVDREMAEASIGKLRELKKLGVELIAAHDDGWCEKNRERFYPGTL